MLAIVRTALPLAALSVMTLPVAALPGAALQEQETDWLIRADLVYTAAGDPIEGGHVLVEDGAIASVGKGGGSGGDVLEVAAVTPGMIDLGAGIDLGTESVEESAEVQPQLSITDSLDLYSYRWTREARSGVTAVLAAPRDDDVIGGLAAVIKTGGAPTLEARLVKEGAVLRGAIGDQPSAGNRSWGTPRDFYSRRPTTRMGVEWELRKAFYDTIAARDDEDRAFPGSDVLDRVLRGELTFSVQAGLTQDVRTAVYLKEEFGIPSMFVDAAAEAWMEPDLVQRSGMGVVLPPFSFDGHTGPGGGFMAWNAAAELVGRGVTVALSGGGSRSVDSRLALQPAFAMRGGLAFDQALAAVTINPARLAGVDDRIGSLEVGKDGDLVLWSGEPFLPTSRVVGVLVDGLLVLDPRPSE